MSVLFIALPLAILLGAAGLFACLYCIRYGQYEDLDTESYRILVDQQPDPKSDPPTSNTIEDAHQQRTPHPDR